jgi:hypothetical protein
MKGCRDCRDEEVPLATCEGCGAEPLCPVCLAAHDDHHWETTRVDLGEKPFDPGPPEARLDEKEAKELYEISIRLGSIGHKYYNGEEPTFGLELTRLSGVIQRLIQPYLRKIDEDEA